MKAQYTTFFKKSLSKILPDSEKIQYLAWLPKLKTFSKKKALNYKSVNCRNDVYNYLNNDLLNNKPINYLEFGVFKGASIKYWSTINTNPKSKLSGFDTFTGLPESWDNFTGGLSKGTFNVDGKFPEINDERVEFRKGLFQETLPDFLNQYNSDNQLVINIDADLYSATLYVLTAAHSIIKPGTIVIFDEFSSVLHEFRALEDYCSAYMRDYEVVCVAESKNTYFAHVAVKFK